MVASGALLGCSEAAFACHGCRPGGVAGLGFGVGGGGRRKAFGQLESRQAKELGHRISWVQS